MRSNIIKNISGDKRLNFFLYLYWLIVAYLNIKLERYKINKKIKIYNFKPKKLHSLSKNKKLSPSRYWSDLLWQELPYKMLFKRGFNALEVGCGSGTYGNFLKKNESFKSYTGLDIKKQWKSQSLKMKFFKDSCDNVDKYLNNINFLFTQSALEHFDEDLDFHKKVSNHINTKKNNNKKFFQLHLVPSEQCLLTYLAHGYRHFSIKSLSKISSFYSNNKTTFLLFKLGSQNSFNIHFKYITLPKFIPKMMSRYSDVNYTKKLDQAILKDIKNPKGIDCSFYGLMILSNYKNSEIKKIQDHYK